MLLIIQRMNAWGCFFVGYFFNIALIYFLIKHKSKEMRIFQKFLLQTCLINLYFLMGSLLLQPVSIFFFKLNMY